MKKLVMIILGLLKAAVEMAERLIGKLESIKWKKSRKGGKRFWNRGIDIPVLYVFYAVAVLILVQSFLLFGDFTTFISHAIITLGIFGFYLFALYHASYEVWSDLSSTVLLMFLTLLNIYGIFICGIYGFESIFPATSTVLIAALVFSKVTTSIFAIFSILLSFVFLTTKNWHYFAIYMLSSFAAVLFSAKINSRRDVIHAGLKLSVINVIIVALARELYILEFSNVGIIIAMFSGVLVSIVNLLFLPLIESVFGRLSPISLVEISDTNRPILKKMMVEAPGTYHHSMVTAALAEAACNAIGASGRLARVGAYYHDIGKLFKPEYFIENQLFISNPHDIVEPSMSGMVLMAHVKEGVELARKNRMNRKIIEFIEEHHGTSLIIQFYQKAIKKDISIDESDFRYSGVKPRSMESAVLMLADSVEAASRSIEALKPSAISNMVRKIINNKFVDGQLNDSPLTLRDIEIISEVMTRTLSGILHVRYQRTEKPETLSETASPSGEEQKT